MNLLLFKFMHYLLYYIYHCGRKIIIIKSNELNTKIENSWRRKKIYSYEYIYEKKKSINTVNFHSETYL